MLFEKAEDLDERDHKTLKEKVREEACILAPENR